MSRLRQERLHALHSRCLDAAQRFPFLTCAAATPHSPDPDWPFTRYNRDSDHFGLTDGTWRSILGEPRSALPVPLSYPRSWMNVAGRLWEVAFYDTRELTDFRLERYPTQEAGNDALRAACRAAEGGIDEFKILAREAAGNFGIKRERPVQVRHTPFALGDAADNWLEELFATPGVEKGGPENFMVLWRLPVNVFTASAMAIEELANWPDSSQAAGSSKTAVRATPTDTDEAEPDSSDAASSRTAICPTCRKPVPVDEFNSVACPNCIPAKDSFRRLWIDLQCDGPLAKDTRDETLAALRHLVSQQFGSFDVAALERVSYWLIAEHGMTREQVLVCRFARLVELLRTRAEKEIQEQDFGIAYQTAEKCILHGNGLIESVKKYGGTYLIPRLQELCRTLDAGQGGIPLVSCWHRVVSAGPFGQAPEIEATAHELAWRFAHRLWGIIHTPLFGEHCLGNCEEPMEGPGFAFRQAVVLSHGAKIADIVSKEKPLEYYDLRPRLSLERDKGLAQFRLERAAAANLGSPAASAVQATDNDNVPVALSGPDCGQPGSSIPGPGEVAPTPFSSGMMAFFEDRVELCGVDICSGRRSKNTRSVLDALSEKRNGSFVAYDGDELAAKIRLIGGRKGVPGLIRNLRKRISQTLMAEANIACGKFDVILRGERRYRLSQKLSVEHSGTNTVHGHDPSPGPTDVRKDVRNVRKANDRNVRKESVPNVRNVSDNTPTTRRAWILQELTNEHRLRAPDVMQRFDCSLKTAERDLQALCKSGTIEFVGAPSTGTYRLKK